MEETYKDHRIRSGAGRMPKGIEWKPIVQINWSVVDPPFGEQVAFLFRLLRCAKPSAPR